MFYSHKKQQFLNQSDLLRPQCYVLNQQLFHDLLWRKKYHPGTALMTEKQEIPSETHLEGQIHGTVSNLVDIWQRPAVVLPAALAQLQILGFLQL